MRQMPRLAKSRAAPCMRVRGFTLFESILVIGLLTLASLGLMAMQPQIFKTQTDGRDQYVGLELLQACAERLLAARRNTGYSAVTTTLCNGMGGLGSFNANPTVALVDALAATTTACGSSVTAAANVSCMATITIAKSSGPAASLNSITIELSNY